MKLLCVNRRHAKWIGIVLLFVTVTVVYFHRYLLFGLSPIPIGQSSVSYSLKMAAVEMLKNRIMPLWNPYILCGTALLGDGISNPLDPLNVLFLFLPPYHAYSMFPILQFFFTGLFMYLFVRSCGIGRFGSIVSSLCYTLSGYFGVCYKYIYFTGATMYLPLILLFLRKAFVTQEVKYSLISSIFVALSFFGGNPVMFYNTILAMGTLWCVYIVSPPIRNASQSTVVRGVRSVTILFITLVIGFCIMAIQFLPTLEFASQSCRYKLPSSQASFSLSNLISILLFYQTEIANTEEIILGIGILPFLLVLVGGYYNRKRMEARFAIALALISLLIPVVLFNIPWIRNFWHSLNIARFYLGRLTFLFPFALSLLAGFGADRIIKHRDKTISKRAIAILFFATLASYILMVMFLSGRVSKMFHLQIWLSGISGNVLHHRLGILLDLISFAVFGIVLRRRKLSTVFCGVTILGVIIINGNYKSYLLHFWEYGEEFPVRYPVVQQLKSKSSSLFRYSSLCSDETYYLSGNTGGALSRMPTHPDHSALYQMYDIAGFHSLILRRYSDFMEMLNYHRVFMEAPYSRVILLVNSKSPLLSLTSLKYLLTYSPISDTQWRLHCRSDSLFIYENKTVMPRAFLVPEAKTVAGKQDLIEEMTCPEFDPLRYVLLEEEPQYSQERDKSLEISDSSSFAKITGYSPKALCIYVEASEPSFLVLTDTYYPGWKAFIDGKETRIYRAYYTFRAIEVPAGKHTVEFIYDPLSFKVGKYITFATIFGIIVFLGVDSRRKRNLNALQKT